MQMRIIVCVKPVQAQILHPNESRGEKYVVNPYDMYALKETLKIKEMMDCTVTCLCMGEINAKQALIKCLAMGADEAILLSDKNAFAQSDTIATSKIIYHAIYKIIHFDLIVCGHKSVDGETGQVKHGLCELLNIDFIECADKIVEINEDLIILRTSREGYTDIVKGYYPLLVSYHGILMDNSSAGIHKMKKAYSTNIPVWNAIDLGLSDSDCGREGSRTEVVGTALVEHKKQSVVIGGSDTEKVCFIQERVQGYRRD